MGDLRVDVLDAADLPSADRNGYSDPYCKFRIGDEKKEIFKTKVQKKTLHPAWNEFFETPIKSRIGADFHVDIYDWDFGDSADWLGAAKIDLEALEPFQATEVTLPLDGKSGVIRLKLLFKPSYVIRSRQGSSTFSGTFAVPGKVIGAPVKGVGFLGSGVVRGASFLKHGLVRGKKDKNGDDTASIHNSILEDPEPRGNAGGLSPAPPLQDGSASSGPSTPVREHTRKGSSVSQVGDRNSIRGESGTANITIVSASDFSTSANVRVLVNALKSNKWKEVHKTKAHKGSGEPIQFNDSFKVPHITAETSFQIKVVDHSTFGSDDVIGETLFFVGDQGSVADQDKTLSIASGNVVIRSSFTPSDSGLRPTTSHSTAATGADDGSESPDSKKVSRRSFLTKNRSVSGI